MDVCVFVSARANKHPSATANSYKWMQDFLFVSYLGYSAVNTEGIEGGEITFLLTYGLINRCKISMAHE